MRSLFKKSMQKERHGTSGSKGGYFQLVAFFEGTKPDWIFCCLIRLRLNNSSPVISK